MKVVIYSYDHTPMVCKIPFDGNIERMEINTDIGDENLLVRYDNETTSVYKAGVFAGDEFCYEIYNKQTGFNVLHNEEWNNCTDSWDRIHIALRLKREFNEKQKGDIYIDDNK